MPHGCNISLDSPGLLKYTTLDSVASVGENPTIRSKVNCTCGCGVDVGLLPARQKAGSATVAGIAAFQVCVARVAAPQHWVKAPKRKRTQQLVITTPSPSLPPAVHQLSTRRHLAHRPEAALADTPTKI